MTMTLLLSITVMFLIETMQPGGSTSLLVLNQMGALGPYVWQTGQWWRLVASPFLHIGILHIVGNAMVLLWVGWIAERVYGPVRYLAIYLSAGMGGALLTVAAGTAALTAGASGAIWGVLGALLIGSWRNQDAIGQAPSREIRQSVLSTIILNALISFLPGVSLTAHLGGFMAGAGLAALMPFRPIGRKLSTLSIADIIAIVLIVLCLLPLLTLSSYG